MTAIGHKGQHLGLPTFIIDGFTGSMWDVRGLKYLYLALRVSVA